MKPLLRDGEFKSDIREVISQYKAELLDIRVRVHGKWLARCANSEQHLLILWKEIWSQVYDSTSSGRSAAW